jgi:hypothetical protein
MDLPEPLITFLNELERHLKEKPLMMCAAAFAWSFAVFRNFGFKLV